jgi:hypothetical protein
MDLIREIDSKNESIKGKILTKILLAKICLDLIENFSAQNAHSEEYDSELHKIKEKNKKIIIDNKKYFENNNIKIENEEEEENEDEEDNQNFIGYQIDKIYADIINSLIKNKKIENNYNNVMKELDKKNFDINSYEVDIKNKQNEINLLKSESTTQINNLKKEINNLKKRENIFLETFNKIKNYNNNNNRNNLSYNNYYNNVPNSLNNSFNNNNNNIQKQNKIIQSPVLNNNMSYMSYQPQKNGDLNLSNYNGNFNNINNNNNELEESFKYSYQLLDNLKNSISKVDFNKDYLNLI